MTPAEIAQRLLPMSQDGSLKRGDADLNPGMPILKEPPVEAAVLVPIVFHSTADPTILLTKRTAHLKAHAGQIAFPGGRRDPEDMDAVATALRETMEETGIPREHIEILGHLDRYMTRTGYAVTPIVGALHSPLSPIPEPEEVAEIFEVPLAHFMNRANHQRHSRDLNGVRRHFYAMPYNDYYIWGATAGMLRNLVDVLE